MSEVPLYSKHIFEAQVRRCKALEQKGEVSAALRHATQVLRFGFIYMYIYVNT